MLNATGQKMLCGGYDMQDEKNNTGSMPHNLIMEQRKKLNVSGVCDVDSFDEKSVLAVTQLGELTISGSSLHIVSFSAEVGELCVEGSISSLTYSEEKPQSSGFFGRVFR